MLPIASRIEYGDLDFIRKPTIPASRSRSASRTSWVPWRASSTAAWQAIVVAPQPPLAEKKPQNLAAVRGDVLPLLAAAGHSLQCPAQA